MTLVQQNISLTHSALPLGHLALHIHKRALALVQLSPRPLSLPWKRFCCLSAISQLCSLFGAAPSQDTQCTFQVSRESRSGSCPQSWFAQSLLVSSNCSGKQSTELELHTVAFRLHCVVRTEPHVFFPFVLWVWMAEWGSDYGFTESCKRDQEAVSKV